MKMNEINMSEDPEFIPLNDFVSTLMVLNAINIGVYGSILKFQLGNSLIHAPISKDGLVDSRILKRHMK